MLPGNTVTMAAITTAAEYAVIREAIQQLRTTDVDVVSFTLGDMTVNYSNSQLDWLERREKELARRLTARNIRKRTISDFSGTDTDRYLYV